MICVHASLISFVIDLHHSIIEGADREKIHKLSGELREKWASMTKEEKITETKDALEELKARNENKQVAVHNAAISSFHDARTNLDAIEAEVCINQTSFFTLLTTGRQIKRLNARTGVEVIMIAVRDTEDAFLEPRSYATSSRMEEWFQAATGINLSAFAVQSEGFVVSGLQGK